MKNFGYIFVFFLLGSFANASPVDTIDNWNLSVNGKKIVFGPWNTSGVSGITINPTDKIEINYNHCTHSWEEKTISVGDENGKLVCWFKNDKRNDQHEVVIEPNKIIEYLKSKNVKGKKFRFVYVETKANKIILGPQLLFIIEIKTK